MFRRLATFILAVVLRGGSDMARTAQDKKTEKAALVSAETEAVETLSAAYSMAKHGRGNKSSGLLFTAARVIGTTPTQKIVTTKAKLQSKSVDDNPLSEVAKLIAEATKLCGENVDAWNKLAAAFEKDAKEFKRGSLLGPRLRQGIGKSNDRQDYFFISFSRPY